MTTVIRTAVLALPLVPILAVAATSAAQQPTWVGRSPTTSPAGRMIHAMAYDAARQRTVLFGGTAGGFAVFGDTWEWDGTNWTLMKPTTSPSARRSVTAAYDVGRGRTVMFGGAPMLGAPFGDTWEWDGRNWAQRKASTSPLARHGHATVYDCARRRTVIFGGYNLNYLADTWEWNGATWTEVKLTNTPPARGVTALAYDASRRRIVLFGGVAGTFSPTAMSDTWEFDGKSWTQIKPTFSPGKRYGHTMVYDPARQRVVLFGGKDPSKYRNKELADTWEFDGKSWTKIKPAKSPVARSHHRAAFDIVRQRVVLFGGSTLTGGIPADTWELDRSKLTLSSNTSVVSVATGGAQKLMLRAGTAHARRNYWIFGSVTGTSPGVQVHGVPIQLNPDLYTDFVMANTNSSVFQGFRGKLDVTGTGTATLNVPKTPAVSFLTLYHAYLVFDASGKIHMASNPVPVMLKN
ncbi:MAG: kelch repeat-containing protein [Planctomycetota bacterium]